VKTKRKESRCGKEIQRADIPHNNRRVITTTSADAGKPRYAFRG